LWWNFYVDHATEYVYVSHQVSLRETDTIKGKHCFENIAEPFNIKIKA